MRQRTQDSTSRKKTKRRWATNDSWFHTHVHSEFSTLDAISSVDRLVEKAKQLNQPAIALTDHGNMSGAVQLYRAGQKFGLPVFPGFEGYLVESTAPVAKKEPAPQRYHLGLLALNLDGYRTLVQLTSLSHTREKFLRFPRFDLSDLAELAGNEDIAVLTGCVSGLPIQTLMKSGEKSAARIIRMFAQWFPNTFVEIQNHGNVWEQPIDKEGNHIAPWTGPSGRTYGKPEKWTDYQLSDALVGMADQLGLPVVVSQDSHYADSKQKEAHALMKRMVYGGGESSEFSGDSFHLATTEWVEEHHTEKRWQKGLEGCKQLLDLHDLEMPALDKFTIHIPTIKKNPRKYVFKRLMKRLATLDEEGLLVADISKYEKRVDHEAEIIDHLDRWDYLTHWTTIIDYCEEEEIAIEARGSANGSLILYLLGITSIDPLKRKTLFERWLSKDRKKMPDIDLDIEDARRGDLIAFMERTFDVVQIGTFAALGARDEDDRGSVLVSYNSFLRKKHGDQFNRKFGPKGLERIADVQRVNQRDYVGLRILSKSKVKRSYGVHAAGILLSGDKQKIADYVPTMLVASSGTTVSQFIMDDVEELGYVKDDILGQRTLTTMRRCQELMGRDNPRDFSWIPDDDKETLKTLREGRTETGIFQFEGYAMAKGARALKIRSTEDCILAGALFRPACMESGMTDLYLERRRDKELRKNIEYPHPVFEKALKSTYGVVLFQEQVLEIMRGLGLDYEGINTFFKIVKDSGKGATDRNEERAAEVKKSWHDICKKNGIEDEEEAWHYIEGYTKYGFNKGHSAGYGVRSYRVAYLKTHHSLEFHAALLESWAGKAKEPVYIAEARRVGLRLLPPDVNVSGRVWTLDRRKQAIRKGLSSIKGVGENGAALIAENAPYEDLDDLATRVKSRSVTGCTDWLKSGEFKGTLAALR
jgi:DNA polymerase-3 subunit alpha